MAATHLATLCLLLPYCAPANQYGSQIASKKSPLVHRNYRHRQPPSACLYKTRRRTSRNSAHRARIIPFRPEYQVYYNHCPSQSARRAPPHPSRRPSQCSRRFRAAMPTHRRIQFSRRNALPASAIAPLAAYRQCHQENRGNYQLDR